MAEQLTFLHAADLHLGAPFRGLRALSPEWADRLHDAIPAAYDRIIETAISNDVAFVVIAGDVFDTASPSYSDFLHFFRGLERLHAVGIPAYLCTGNHDPFSSWRKDFAAFPDSVTMFPAAEPGYALFEREGYPTCVLAGRSYGTKVWSADESIAEGVTRAAADEALAPRGAAAPFGVGVLHTGLDIDLAKAPAEPAELLASGMDYWALGHIHRRAVDSMDNPKLVFPGCIQGRDIKESGTRGIALVTLEEGAPNRVRFVPTASIVWEQLRVDVAGCETLAQVTDRAMRAQFVANGKGHCEKMVTRITLVGATELHDVLLRPGVLEDLRRDINDAYADFFCDALLDATSRPLDRAALLEEGLFPATLMRAADRARADGHELTAYLQEEFLTRNLAMPTISQKRLAELSREAEELVFDLLVGGEAR